MDNSRDLAYLSELEYFQMQMLQARIEMEGMVAENQRHPGTFGKADFDALVEKHGIYHNAFPFRRG